MYLCRNPVPYDVHNMHRAYTYSSRHGHRHHYHHHHQVGKPSRGTWGCGMYYTEYTKCWAAPRLHPKEPPPTLQSMDIRTSRTKAHPFHPSKTVCAIGFALHPTSYKNFHSYCGSITDHYPKASKQANTGCVNERSAQSVNVCTKIY